MTVTGSGVGGNVGGPQAPLQRDLEATAWTETNKSYLAIVKDNLEQSFTQLIQRYAAGDAEFFGRYMSSESRPLLDHPLEIARTNQGFDAQLDEASQNAYNELFDKLPSDIQKSLTQEFQKTLDDRDSNFTALNNVLTAAANFLGRAGQLSQPISPDSQIMARTQINQLLPLYALQGFVGQASEIQSFSSENLLEKGPNYYHFDAMNNFLTQTNSTLNNLGDLLEEIRSGGTPKTVEKMSNLATTVNGLNNQYQTSGFRDELQILGPTLNAMEILTSAWSLAGKGSPSLYLGLSIASTGINTTDSETGIFGKAYSGISQALAESIQSSLIPQANLGQTKMISLFTQTALGLLSGMASQIQKNGLGNYPSSDSNSLNYAHLFASDLALQFLQSSGFIQTLFESSLNVSGGNKNAQAKGSEILSQAATLLMISSIANQAKQDPTNLVESQQAYLDKGISTASELVSNQEASSNQANALKIALKQSSMALESKDYEGFTTAFNSLLENMGSSQEELKKDLKVLSNTAQTITTSFSAQSQEPVTGVVTIV